MMVINGLPAHDSVVDMFRQLLVQIEVGRYPEDEIEQDASGDEHVGDDIVCEVEVDGVQYTLTRRRCSAETGGRIYLSPREKEVVRLVMKGFSTRGIASVLDISPWTVSTHLRRVFGKLGVNSRAEMVACVLQDSFISSTLNETSQL
jgi:DNA-binding CsgD family transcriptional regulator